MFQKLQTKWKVGGWRFLLIILTFAVGGSLCGIAGRKLLEFSGMEKGAGWIVSYILLITLLWPLCVLLISLPLGQFRFFKRYIQKIFSRMGGKKAETPQKTSIAIFASGAGSNAEKIIGHFKDSNVLVALIVCNKPGAGVINIAKINAIPVLMVEKEHFFSAESYVRQLKNHSIDWIILAGFLWKVPLPVINAFTGRIINIHPALLPKYGGKGMYGQHVHEAVIANRDAESGISVHFVDEFYDHGKIILQEKCIVDSGDTAASLAEKIHVLEHRHYPAAIEAAILKAKA